MELSEEQKVLMESHLDAVIKMNEKINLTRIVNRDSALVLHLEDSLSALEEFLTCPEGPYADLGTGGGFPGITLSIATGHEVLLVDSVAKKCRALDEIINQLSLSDSISTYPKRIEELAVEKPKYFSVLTARALSSLPSLLELACPLLRQGGRLISYKGSNYQEELEQALGLEKKLAMHFVSQRSFQLSDGSPRTILVFEKCGKPKVKLPRRMGMAQKQPFMPA